MGLYRVKGQRCIVIHVGCSDIVAASEQRENLMIWQEIRDASIQERIELERNGVPVETVMKFKNELLITSGQLAQAMGMTPDALRRRLANDKGRFRGVQAWTVLGLMDLVAFTDALADRQLPEKGYFDPAGFLGKWLFQPQPLIGGLPAWIADTPSGRKELKRVIGVSQLGAGF